MHQPYFLLTSGPGWNGSVTDAAEITADQCFVPGEFSPAGLLQNNLRPALSPGEAGFSLTAVLEPLSLDHLMGRNKEDRLDGRVLFI